MKNINKKSLLVVGSVLLAVGLVGCTNTPKTTIDEAKNAVNTANENIAKVNEMSKDLEANLNELNNTLEGMGEDLNKMGQDMAKDAVDTTKDMGDDMMKEVNDAMGMDTTDTDDMGSVEMVNGYMSYSQELMDKGLAGGSKVALFFNADWCSSCVTLNKNITENSVDIPKDVLVLKVNYDTEKDLKDKYGVKSQHTVVYVDGEGNGTATKLGLFKLSDVLENIK